MTMWTKRVEVPSVRSKACRASRFREGVTVLLIMLGAQVVFAQPAPKPVDVSGDDLDVAIERYAEQQRRQRAQEACDAELGAPASDRFWFARAAGDPVAWFSSVRPEGRDRSRSPAVTLGAQPARGLEPEAEMDAPILACSFPSLALQEEPATQPAEQPAGKAAAGADQEDSLEDINNKLNNPGASLASLNFKFTWNHYKGDLPEASSQNSLAMNFQPVFPFKLDDRGSNLMVRPSIPVVWQPSYNAGRRGFDENFGIGDSQLVMFYANTNKETGFFWGAGPTMQFPTHTDDVLGNDAFMIGPAAYTGVMGKWGVVGVFPQHWWNIGGGDGYTSLTATQVFCWFSVGKGYQIGGAPTITYNWAADDSDQAWTVPVNLGVAKTVMLGGTPVKLKFEGIYYIVQPDAFGPHCGLQLTITPVIPNPFDALFAKK